MDKNDTRRPAGESKRKNTAASVLRIIDCPYPAGVGMRDVPLRPIFAASLSCRSNEADEYTPRKAFIAVDYFSGMQCCNNNFCISCQKILRNKSTGIHDSPALGGAMTHVIMIAANLLYYLALFYPVFRIVTMDRNEEVVRYRLMKTLLAIFIGVHILMGFVMAMLVRA
jgi:hypothetical protein